MSIKFFSKSFKEEEIVTLYLKFITQSRQNNEMKQLNYIRKKQPNSEVHQPLPDNSKVTVNRDIILYWVLQKLLLIWKPNLILETISNQSPEKSDPNDEPSDIIKSEDSLSFRTLKSDMDLIKLENRNKEKKRQLLKERQKPNSKLLSVVLEDQLMVFADRETKVKEVMAMFLENNQFVKTQLKKQIFFRE